MLNIDNEINKILIDLTKLFKDELIILKLVDSGDLLKSIKFTLKRDSNGYHIQMSALDYYKYLNKTYEINDKVFKSSGFRAIKTRIAQIYKQQLLQELTIGLKKQ